MDSKMKINRDQETRYISVYRIFEEIIWFHEAMSVKQGHSYARIELLRQEKMIKSTWVTWVKLARVTQDGYRWYILGSVMDIYSAHCSSVIGQVR